MKPTNRYYAVIHRVLLGGLGAVRVEATIDLGLGCSATGFYDLDGVRVCTPDDISVDDQFDEVKARTWSLIWEHRVAETNDMPGIIAAEREDDGHYFLILYGQQGDVPVNINKMLVSDGLAEECLS